MWWLKNLGYKVRAHFLLYKLPGEKKGEIDKLILSGDYGKVILGLEAIEVLGAPIFLPLVANTACDMLTEEGVRKRAEKLLEWFGTILDKGKISLDEEIRGQLIKLVNEYYDSFSELERYEIAKVLGELKLKGCGWQLIVLAADENVKVKEAAKQAMKRLEYSSSKQIFENLPPDEQGKLFDIVEEWIENGVLLGSRGVTVPLNIIEDVEPRWWLDQIFKMMACPHDPTRRAATTRFEQLAEKIKSGAFTFDSKCRNKAISLVKIYTKSVEPGERAAAVKLALELELMECLPEICLLLVDKDEQVKNLAEKYLEKIGNKIKKGEAAAPHYLLTQAEKIMDVYISKNQKPPAVKLALELELMECLPEICLLLVDKDEQVKNLAEKYLEKMSNKIKKGEICLTKEFRTYLVEKVRSLTSSENPELRLISTIMIQKLDLVELLPELVILVNDRMCYRCKQNAKKGLATLAKRIQEGKLVLSKEIRKKVIETVEKYFEDPGGWFEGSVLAISELELAECVDILIHTIAEGEELDLSEEALERIGLKIRNGNLALTKEVKERCMTKVHRYAMCRDGENLWRHRFASLKAIKELELKECLEELILLMADPDDDVRKLAQEVAKKWGYKSIEDVYLTGLSKPERRELLNKVREYASSDNAVERHISVRLIDALGSKQEQHLKELILLMADPDDDVRKLAQEVAKKWGYKSIEDVYNAYCRSGGDINDFVKQIKNSLNGSNLLEKSRAICIVFKLNMKKHLEDAFDALFDLRISVRSVMSLINKPSLEAFFYDLDKNSQQRIIKKLEEESSKQNWQNRLQAVMCMVALNVPETIPLLINSIQDKDFCIRNNARSTMKKLSEKEILIVDETTKKEISTKIQDYMERIKLIGQPSDEVFEDLCLIGHIMKNTGIAQCLPKLIELMRNRAYAKTVQVLVFEMVKDTRWDMLAARGVMAQLEKLFDGDIVVRQAAMNVINMIKNRICEQKSTNGPYPVEPSKHKSEKNCCLQKSPIEQ